MTDENTPATPDDRRQAREALDRLQALIAEVDAGLLRAVQALQSIIDSPTAEPQHRLRAITELKRVRPQLAARLADAEAAARDDAAGETLYRGWKAAQRRAAEPDAGPADAAALKAAEKGYTDYVAGRSGIRAK